MLLGSNDRALVGLARLLIAEGFDFLSLTKLNPHNSGTRQYSYHEQKRLVSNHLNSRPTRMCCRTRTREITGTSPQSRDYDSRP